MHILYLVNGNHSFTLFPFYLINIFITKLLEEKPSRKGWLLFMCKKLTIGFPGNRVQALYKSDNDAAGILVAFARSLFCNMK